MDGMLQDIFGSFHRYFYYFVVCALAPFLSVLISGYAHWLTSGSKNFRSLPVLARYDVDVDLSLGAVVFCNVMLYEYNEFPDKLAIVTALSQWFGGENENSKEYEKFLYLLVLVICIMLSAFAIHRRHRQWFRNAWQIHREVDVAWSIGGIPERATLIRIVYRNICGLTAILFATLLLQTPPFPISLTTQI